MPLSASIPVNSYSPCPAPPSGWIGGFQLTSSSPCERELSLATVLRLHLGDQAVAGEKRGAPGQSCPLKSEGGREHTDRLRSDRREGDQDRELCRLESVRAELGLIHPGQLARLAPCGKAMAAQAKVKVHLVGHCDTCICTFMRCKVACDAPHALLMRVPACNSETRHVQPKADIRTARVVFKSRTNTSQPIV